MMECLWLDCRNPASFWSQMGKSILGTSTIRWGSASEGSGEFWCTLVAGGIHGGIVSVGLCLVRFVLPTNGLDVVGDDMKRDGRDIIRYHLIRP